LMAYCNGGGRWELNLYDEIADAMKEAAEATGVKLRWGAAWTIDDIGAWEGSAENAMNSYIDTRRSQGRRPFIDAPHFEVVF
jgi:peptidoglycan L-alanyl-D-glutamate endopeptidase CwlK